MSEGQDTQVAAAAAAVDRATSITDAADAVSAVNTAPSPFDLRLKAHTVSVGLVEAEAAILAASGDVQTADLARRVHILAEGLLFLLANFYVQDDDKTPAPAARVFDPEYTAKMAEADAATSGA